MTLIPVLLYHSVTSDPARRGDRFTVSYADFAMHADELRASGRTPLCMTELAEALRGERPLPERPVAVTFDDGYADTYDAVQALLARGISATVYATAGEIATPSRLSAARLHELAHTPSVEIGAHSFNRRRLDELDAYTPCFEARASKLRLETLTQIEIRSFAYPHGAYDERARQAVIDAGFRSAAAVKNALSHSADDVFAIARWTVTAGTPASRIAQVLEGVGVPIAWAGERFRTRAYRFARRHRRLLGNPQ
jgi:peptidoglycan/xylan/chitin deacetylase (PgdA/CDA1 family)